MRPVSAAVGVACPDVRLRLFADAAECDNAAVGFGEVAGPLVKRFRLNISWLSAGVNNRPGPTIPFPRRLLGSGCSSSLSSPNKLDDGICGGATSQIMVSLPRSNTGVWPRTARMEGCGLRARASGDDNSASAAKRLVLETGEAPCSADREADNVDISD